MAANSFAAVIPSIMAQGLMALRQNSIMPLLVDQSYGTDNAQQGDTINIPVPSAVPVVDVVPSATAPDAAAITPTKRTITLDTWIEAPFDLSDKEALEIDETSTINGAISEAIKALANRVDTDIMGQYVNFYGVAGTAGVTPFAGGTTADAQDIRKVLNQQLAPMDERRLVLDPEAEASALGLRAMQDYAWNNDLAAIRDGVINQRFGLSWHMDQNVVTHTAGTASGYTVNGVNAVDATTVNLTGGTGTYVVGDIITFAGDSQTYTVTQAEVSVATSVNIQPPLQVATAGSEAVTTTADHTVNLCFQRKAIVFASRALPMALPGMGVETSVAIDPISGIALRLEVKRENKRNRWSFDILYGVGTARPEFGARLLG